MTAQLTVAGLPAATAEERETSVHNAALLIFAALHFCEQAGTVDQFHAFSRQHLGMRTEDLPPAGVLGWLGRAVAQGQGLNL